MINIHIYEADGGKTGQGSASLSMGAPAPQEDITIGGTQEISGAGSSFGASSETGPPPTLFDGDSMGQSAGPATSPDEMMEFAAADSSAPSPTMMADASPGGQDAPGPAMQAGEADGMQSGEAPGPSMEPGEENKGSKSPPKEDTGKKK